MTDDLTPEDRSEFGRLLDEILPDLYRLARWLARDQASAEDLVQEASLRAYGRFRQFEKGTNFKAWLFRILHNHFLDQTRRGKRQAHSTDFAELEPVAPATIEGPIGLDVADLDSYVERVDESVAGAIAALPETYRTPFLLFALGDLSYEEIASTLGIPVGTVMSRLFRARQKLQGTLVTYATENGLLRPR